MINRQVKMPSIDKKDEKDAASDDAAENIW